MGRLTSLHKRLVVEVRKGRGTRRADLPPLLPHSFVPDMDSNAHFWPGSRLYNTTNTGEVLVYPYSSVVSDSVPPSAIEDAYPWGLFPFCGLLPSS